MIVDPAVLPGLLLLAAEFAVLSAVGYVVTRVALRQDDGLLALAQGLVVGLALWGLITNFVLYLVPGLAGAAVGWGVVLTLAAALAWRAPAPIRPEPRVLAGFVVVVLAVVGVALASKQLTQMADEAIHLGLSAVIRAGGFPPELPWNPGVLARYHHGADLVVGLLAPPFGPDMAFAWEVFGAYAWASFALVVVTALARRGSWWIALLLAPLLLSDGRWTWVPFGPGILQGPVPAGLPAAGLRASLTDLYWPIVGESFVVTDALPDIWKPSYTLSYALAVVVLERAAHVVARSWPVTLTLAGVIGFLGLLSTSMAPVVLVLWAGLEALGLGQAWRSGTLTRRDVLRPGAGLALAVAVLLVGGSRFTGLLDDSTSSGLAWGWDFRPRDLRVLGVFEALPGGVGLVALGPLAVAGLAALLARRDRLVLALAAGAGLLAVAWLVLRYEPFPADINRLTGHARNLALVALLLALSGRMAGLRPRWRYAVGALLVGLVIWPTSMRPVRNLGIAIGQGVEIANAGWAQPESGDEPAWGVGRTVAPDISARLAAYVRDHTAVDARVFVPAPHYLAMTFATGRPHSAGFVNIVHLLPHAGPEFLDARRYLEPAALGRMGIEYVYATDTWVDGLPDRARAWLADPELFEVLARDVGVTLYRVRPAFLALDPPPIPASFEALRRAVPAGTTVYWPAGAPFESHSTLRVVSVLSPQAELYGPTQAMLQRIYALNAPPAERLGELTPDLVILPVGRQAWMFPPPGRQPIWWNAAVAVYAPRGAVAPVMAPLEPAPAPEPPPIDVHVSDVRETDGRLAFTLTVNDHTPDRWTGQDWQLFEVDASPWAIPTRWEGGKPVADQWFAGQVIRGRGTTTHAYVYDAGASSLAVRSGDGAYRTEKSSAGVEGPGTWTLALRFRREVDRGAYLAHETAAVIRVLSVTVSATGDVSYSFFGDLRDG